MTDIPEIMLKCFGKEDNELTKKLNKAYGDQLAIEEIIRNLQKECTHPKKYVKIESRGFQDSDSYGDLGWVDLGYQADCSLCKKSNIGRFDPNKRHDGDQIFQREYLKQLKRDHKAHLKWKANYEKEKELKELAKLKSKYETP